MKSIRCKCRPSRLTLTKSRTASFSSSCAQADTTIKASGAMPTGPGSRNRTSAIHVFGSSAKASGSIAPCFETVPLPLDWPVYVSHAEAAAYARFVGKSLPTEAQFHRAAYGTPEGMEREYPWGDAPPDVGRGNFDFQRWDPVAVGSYPARSQRFRMWRMLSATVGNGPPRSLRPSRASSLFPFTAATRRTFSTESIM